MISLNYRSTASVSFAVLAIISLVTIVLLQYCFHCIPYTYPKTILYVPSVAVGLFSVISIISAGVIHLKQSKESPKNILYEKQSNESPKNILYEKQSNESPKNILYEKQSNESPKNILYEIEYKDFNSEIIEENKETGKDKNYAETISLLIEHDFKNYKNNITQDNLFQNTFEQNLRDALKDDPQFLNKKAYKSNTEYIDLVLFIVSKEAGERYLPLLKILEQIVFEKKIDLQCNTIDMYGNTPLLWAIAQGNHHIANQLLYLYEQHKFPIDINHQSDHAHTTENTALILCIAKGHRDYVYQNGWNVDISAVSDYVLAKRMLKLGANPNIKNSLGYTAIDYAILRGDIKMIKLLLKYHSKIPNQQEVEELFEIEWEDEDVTNTTVTEIFVATTAFKNDTAITTNRKFKSFKLENIPNRNNSHSR